MGPHAIAPELDRSSDGLEKREKGMTTDVIAPMAERYARPDWVRRMNSMADAIGGDARRLIPIDAANLLEAAIQTVGRRPSGDFGDPLWQSRFEALADAVNATEMHVVGRLITKQELLRALCTRLLYTRAADENPAISDEKIDAPVIITGPARSGTSILFELLALDPDFYAPPAWEALHPFVYPGQSGEADRRLAMSECEQEFWADVQPEFAAIHELRSDLPVECVTLTAPSFCGSHWAIIAQLGAWAPDLLADYAFHRRALQVLQHGSPDRRWLLKTPGHMMALEALFSTYPDAWLIQTHRDPAKTMPSTASTTAMVQWMRTDAVDVPSLAAAIEGIFSFALNQSVELRKTGAVPDRFVDIHFREMMKDPVATIRAAYDTMEREFSDEHGERIRVYLAEKPKGKFGTHQYTPEEWGFTAARLQEQMAPYIAHFGVELED